MTQGQTRRQPAWAELGFVTALGVGVFAFLLEARGVSRSQQNLLLLQPTAWLVLALWAVIAAGCLLRRVPVDAPPGESRADQIGRAHV